MFSIYDDFAIGKTTTEYETSWRFIEELFRKRFRAKVPFVTMVTNSTDKEEWGNAWEKICTKIIEVAEVHEKEDEKLNSSRSEKSKDKRRSSTSAADKESKSKKEDS